MVSGLTRRAKFLVVLFVVLAVPLTVGLVVWRSVTGAVDQAASDAGINTLSTLQIGNDVGVTLSPSGTPLVMFPGCAPQSLAGVSVGEYGAEWKVIGGADLAELEVGVVPPGMTLAEGSVSAEEAMQASPVFVSGVGEGLWGAAFEVGDLDADYVLVGEERMDRPTWDSTCGFGG